VAAACPTAVAIHDDRDVARYRSGHRYTARISFSLAWPISSAAEM
jgi:hypothetical protein